MIRRLLALAVIGAVALSTVASASGSAAPRARSAASWTVKVTAPGHKPKARKRWPVKIVAKTSSGKAVSGTVQYLFLFNGTVVSTRSCLDVGTTPCKFRGTYRDVLHFPARAIGQSFTLQFVVKSSLGTKKINYPITVVK
jgi:hypothetical protein